MYATGFDFAVCAHHKKEVEQGLKIYSKCRDLCYLNGSRSKLFIDPEVDLTTLRDDFNSKDWILDN